MSIQGQAIRAASAIAETPLPPEIAFLSRHGIDIEILRQAAETADAVGVTTDVAVIKCDLVEEIFLYKALADELGLPFPTRSASPTRRDIQKASSPASFRSHRRSGPLAMRSRRPASR